jgi:hypothetical protein
MCAHLQLLLRELPFVRTVLLESDNLIAEYLSMWKLQPKTRTGVYGRKSRDDKWDEAFVALIRSELSKPGADLSTPLGAKPQMPVSWDGKDYSSCRLLRGDDACIVDKAADAPKSNPKENTKKRKYLMKTTNEDALIAFLHNSALQAHQN